MTHFAVPHGYDRIGIVDDFDALAAQCFGPRVNALCWSRELAGNFDEVAAHFAGEDEIISLDDAVIASLRPRLSAGGQLAADILLADVSRLRERGLSPSLECVPVYPRDVSAAVIVTDVYSFHADRAPVYADTWLCSYNQTSTEALRNDMAQKRVDMPATRARLLNEFKESGEEDFEGWLENNCYDLHYAPADDAAIFSFGVGNLWRIAVQHPGSPVPPCIHRAPQAVAGRPPRLLLIS